METGQHVLIGGMVWFDLIRFDLIRFDLIWFDLICSKMGCIASGAFSSSRIVLKITQKTQTVGHQRHSYELSRLCLARAAWCSCVERKVGETALVIADVYCIVLC